MTHDADSAESPLVVVVVLTWNDTKMTTDCVGSVLASDYSRFKVILVDNGSREPCGQQVKASFPAIELITLPENQGFTGGSNRGIERALELGADYVHLVGNDATLEPNAISKLVEAMEARPEVGVASPLLLNPGPERIVQFYTGSNDFDCAMHYNHDFSQPVDSRQWPTVRSDFVPFVAVMFRRRVLDECGLFDESFATCCEDFDLCARILRAGWQIITVGDAMAAHIGSQTTGKVSPYIVYYTTRNRLICLFRHGRKLMMLKRLGHIIQSFWWQMRKYGLTNWPCHWACFRGWLDFVLGVRGKGWAAKGVKPKSRAERGGSNAA